MIALAGRLRCNEHRSVPESRTHLAGRILAISERAVTHLHDRYEELLAVALADDRRLQAVLAKRGRVVLAIDGWRIAPTMGLSRTFDDVTPYAVERECPRGSVSRRVTCWP